MAQSLSTFLGTMALCSTLVPNVVNACTKGPVHIQRFSRNTVIFLGTSTADTMLAGTGGIRYKASRGDPLDTLERPVYGQVITIEKVPAIDRNVLPPGVTRVLLVPWGYGADCTPIHRRIVSHR